MEVHQVIQSVPFSRWSFEVSDDPDLGETNYVFRQEGVDVISDSSGTVSTVFLHSSSGRRFEPELEDLPFAWSRAKARSILGSPSQSGEGRLDPVLGDYGPWDRFRYEGFEIHAQYAEGGASINLLTFMRQDVVP